VADYSLQLELRENAGKGVARKLRARGRIPGVCYGAGVQTRAISLDPKLLEKALRTSSAGVNTLFGVQGGGEFDGKSVLVKELQRDPVAGSLLHADFYAVDLTKEIEVAVPLHLTGSAAGLMNGGIVDHQLREIQIACLPTAIPESFTLDVSALDIGDSLHVRDIVLPAGVTLVSSPDLSVVSVVIPAKAEEEVTAEAAAAEAAAAPAEGEEGAAPAEGEAAAAAPKKEERGKKDD
jgi:large subunit ribosomal protein L25